VSLCSLKKKKITFIGFFRCSREDAAELNQDILQNLVYLMVCKILQKQQEGPSRECFKCDGLCIEKRDSLFAEGVLEVAC
jgi:hypothetical protein